MRYLIFFILLSCQSNIQAEHLRKNSVSSSWFVCPTTTKDMTEFQKQISLFSPKIDGTVVIFDGIVKDVKYDAMDQSPVIFLASPIDDSTVNTVFGFIPTKLIGIVLKINKKDKVVLTGHIVGECNTGALDTIYVDMAVESIEVIK